MARAEDAGPFLTGTYLGSDSSNINHFGLRCCWKTNGFPNIERIHGFFSNVASIVKEMKFDFLSRFSFDNIRRTL